MRVGIVNAVVIVGGHRGPPVVGVCTPVVPLIRHGYAMPPSPLWGEGFDMHNRKEQTTCDWTNG